MSKHPFDLFVEYFEKSDWHPMEKAGMFTSRGYRIPAHELQQPNIIPSSARAKTWRAGSPSKQLAGTSIGQGESVREGDVVGAHEAAGRALRYQQRMPKPKLPG